METHYDLENSFALILMVIVGILNFIIMIPWPPVIMANLLRVSRQAGRSEQARWTFFMVLAVVFVMFCWSFWALRSVQSELDAMKANSAINAVVDMETRLSMNLKKFRTQRNVYITGFSLFSSLILLRFHKILSQIGDLNDKLERTK